MNLARLRKAKGLTQADLAEMIGVDQSTIQRAEKEHPSAKLQTYKLCADRLGVTLADLFSESRSVVEDQLIKGFRDMPESSRDKVLAILDLVGGNTSQPG